MSKDTKTPPNLKNMPIVMTVSKKTISGFVWFVAVSAVEDIKMQMHTNILSTQAILSPLISKLKEFGIIFLTVFHIKFSKHSINPKKMSNFLKLIIRKEVVSKIQSFSQLFGNIVLFFQMKCKDKEFFMKT